MAQLALTGAYQRGLRQLETERGFQAMMRNSSSRNREAELTRSRRVERNVMRRKSMGGSGG